MMGGQNMKKYANMLPLLLLAAGALLLVAGGMNGEFRAIYLNARILCLSCIGVQ